jgi:hypothetical protein
MTLFLRDEGQPIWSFGLVLGLAYLFRSLGSLLGEKFESLSQNKWFFAIGLFIFLSLQIMFGFVEFMFTLILIAILYFAWGVLEVLAYAKLHSSAESNFRATAESIVSQLEQLMSLVFGLVFSSLAKQFDIPLSISITAMVGMGIFIAFIILNRR